MLFSPACLQRKGNEGGKNVQSKKNKNDNHCIEEKNRRKARAWCSCSWSGLSRQTGEADSLKICFEGITGAICIAKGITMLTKQQTQVLKSGKIFVSVVGWETAGRDSISEALICEKTRKRQKDLTQENAPRATSDKFKASRGCFAKFCKRSDVYSVLRCDEDSSSHKAANKRTFTRLL